MQDYNVEFEG